MARIGATVAVRGVSALLQFLRENGTPNFARLHFKHAAHHDVFIHGFYFAGSLDLPLEVSSAYAEALLDRFATAPEFEGYHDLTFEDSNSLIVSWDIDERGFISEIL